jgi:hypothetical protein
VDTSRATPQLRDFAVTLLNLRKIETAGAFELYVPNAMKNSQ